MERVTSDESESDLVAVAKARNFAECSDGVERSAWPVGGGPLPCD